MVDVFRLQNFRLKKKRKGLGSYFTLHHAASVKLIKAISRIALKGTGEDGNGPVVILHECIGSLIHRKDVFVHGK